MKKILALVFVITSVYDIESKVTLENVSLVSIEQQNTAFYFNNNPFNPTTTIRFSLLQGEHVTLKVFDILGREVTTLINEEINPGTHSIIFDAKRLTSGIYFYRLTTPTFSQTKSMVLLK